MRIESVTLVFRQFLKRGLMVLAAPAAVSPHEERNQRQGTADDSPFVEQISDV